MNLRPGNPAAVQFQAASRQDRGQFLRDAKVVATGNGTIDVVAVGSAMPMVQIPVSGNMPNVGDTVQLRYVDGRYTATASTPNTPLTGTSGSISLTGTGAGGGGSGGSAFPLPHAFTHASTGTDPVTPASIGAATPAQITSAINAHLAATNPHPQYVLGTVVSVTSGKTLTVTNSLTLSGTDGKTLTLTGSLTIGADTTITGGGTISLGSFTLTVPATGTAVLTSRQITTVVPLQGGGNLGADLTLSISAATETSPGSMSAADKTKLDQFVLTAGKTFTFTNTHTVSGTDGVTLTLTGSLTIGANTTITGGGTISLGGFTFTIPATSTAAMKDVDSAFSAGQTFGSGLTISAGQTLSFASDTIVQRLSAHVIGLGTTDAIQSSTYTSGLLGWQINAQGNAEFDNVTVRGAIRASIILYNAIMATAGTVGIFKSAAKLKADLVVPASPTYGTTTVNIDVNDADGLAHASSQLFAVNDILQIKDGLVGSTWFKVSSVSDQTTFYRYTSIIMAGANGVTYYAGLGVADYGQSGNGFILESADQANTPWIQMATHAGTFTSQDANGTLSITPQLRIGNLNGSFGYSTNIYGFSAGQYGAANKSWITVDQTSGIRIGNNVTQIAQWDISGNILVGQAAASQSNVYITSGGVNIRNNTTVLGLWDASGNITIGQVAAAQSNLYISSGEVDLRINTTNRIQLTSAGVLAINDSGGNAVITLNAALGAQITKKLTLDGASSALALGNPAPTSAAAGEGWWMDRTGLYGLNNSVLQAKLDAVSGRIVAGAGVVYLANNGLWVTNRPVTPVDNALLIAPFDGNATADSGVNATTSGGVIYVTGKFGQAAQIAEATTNLFTNPSFETGTTGYSAYNGSTIAQSSTVAYRGTYSLSVTPAGTGQGVSFPNTAGFAASASNTISVWVYSTANANISLHATNNIDLDEGTTTVAVTANTWTRIVRTFTTNTNTTIGGQVYSDTNAVFYVDAFQGETKAYVTPYCDGSLGAGHTWSGTANASTSSRTEASLYYLTTNNILAAQGTVMCWIYVNAYNSIGPFIWSAGSANALLDSYIDGSGNLIFRVNNVAVAHGTAVTLNTWHHIACTWDTVANTMAIYLDGVNPVTGTPTSALPAMNSYLSVCYSVAVGAGYRMNGYVDDFVTCSRALTAVEIAAIANGAKPVMMNAYATFGVSAANTVYWGGLTLDRGDVLIGGSSNYVKWDSDTSILTTTGTIQALAGYFGSAANGLSVGATGLTINGTGYITLANNTVQLNSSGLFVQDLSFVQQVQVGNLTGLSDSNFPGGISGYGIYVKNAYVVGNIVATAGTLSSLSITGKLTMSGASSAIAIGATPPTSATAGTGIWLDRTGLYGLNANVQNFKLDATTGQITAVAGTVGGWVIGATSISSTGVTLTSDATEARLSFLSGATEINRLSAAGMRWLEDTTTTPPHMQWRTSVPSGTLLAQLGMTTGYLGITGDTMMSEVFTRSGQVGSFINAVYDPTKAFDIRNWGWHDAVNYPDDVFWQIYGMEGTTGYQLLSMRYTHSTHARTIQINAGQDAYSKQTIIYGGVGFFGTTPPTQQTVTGSRGGNAALASFLTALANYGLIVNSTSA